MAAVPRASRIENGNGATSTGRRTTTLILAIMAMPGLERDGCICGPGRAPSRHDPRTTLPNVRQAYRRLMSSAHAEALCLPAPVYASLPHSSVAARSSLASMPWRLVAPHRKPCRCGAFAKWPPPIASVIEAEWRKRAVGVVPAQPNERPEGDANIPLSPMQRS